MNQGSRRGPIVPANWPGMTRPVLWTSRSGRTTAGGRLFLGAAVGPGDGGDRGPVGRLRPVGVEAGRQVRPPGEHDVVAGRVVVRGVRQRADHRPEVAALGQQRQVLADVDARRAGGDRAGTRRGCPRGRRAWGRSCRAGPGRRRGRCRSPTAAVGLVRRGLVRGGGRRSAARCSIPSPSRPTAPAWRAKRRETAGCRGVSEVG